ncbi:hypothetical protein C0995_004359, partial [Termitomyces sp. Mi166
QLEYEMQRMEYRLRPVFHDEEKCKRLFESKTWAVQRLLDFFQWLLWTRIPGPPAPASEDLRNNLILAMQRLSSSSQLYPTCYEIKNVVQNGSDPVVLGGFSDIYKGTFQGQAVAIKLFRFDDTGQIQQSFSYAVKEAIIWEQLSHPNILAFYGIYWFQNRLCLVSPWMQNGNIIEYLEQYPRAPRMTLTADVANGLTYLHKMNIIHGSLMGSNILVNDVGRALVADFSNSSVSVSSLTTWAPQSEAALKASSIRWQAPEMFMDQHDDEIKRTFQNIQNEYTVVQRVLSGTRPRCPEPSSPPWDEWGLTEEIWSLMELCWREEASRRPSAIDIIQFLTEHFPQIPQPSLAVSMTFTPPPAEFLNRTSNLEKLATLKWANHFLANINGSEVVMQVDQRAISFIATLRMVFDNVDKHGLLTRIQKLEARRFMNVFQWLLDSEIPQIDLRFRMNLIGAMQELSWPSAIYPACYVLTDVTKTSQWPVFVGHSGDIFKGSFRGRVDAKINISFKVYPESQFFTVVSPWMEHGNISNYLRHNLGAARPKLAIDVANGLSYLHAMGISHGNVQASNVLVNDAGQALLAGFRLASILNSDVITSLPTDVSRVATPMWSAPELFSTKKSQDITTAIDIYAWGYAAILLQTKNGVRPKRPEPLTPASEQWGLTEDLWRLMERCWQENPSQRPPASEIVQCLTMGSFKDTLSVKESEMPSFTWSQCRVSSPFPEVTIKELDDMLFDLVAKHESEANFNKRSSPAPRFPQILSLGVPTLSAGAGNILDSPSQSSSAPVKWAETVASK